MIIKGYKTMKLTKLALIGAVTLSSVSVGTSAFAAEKDGGKLDSKAFIKFEKIQIKLMLLIQRIQMKL